MSPPALWHAAPAWMRVGTLAALTLAAACEMTTSPNGATVLAAGLAVATAHQATKETP